MSSLDAKLIIEAEVARAEGVADLVAEVNKLGGATDATTREAVELAAELERVNRQAGLVEGYAQLTAKAQSAAEALEAAQGASRANAAAQDQLRANLAATAEALAVVSARTADAQQQGARLRVQASDQAAAIADLRARLKGAGSGADELRAELARLLDQQRQTKAEAAALKAELRELERTGKSLEKAVAQDERALSGLSQASTVLADKTRVAAEALQSQQSALDETGRALRRNGLDANRLAEEQQRLTREGIIARTRTAELTESLREQRTALLAQKTAQDGSADSTRRYAAEQREAGQGGGLFNRSLAFTNTVLGALATAGRASVDALQTGFRDLFKVGAQFEVFQKQLEGAFGGVTQGEAALAFVKEFAKTTPLELGEVLNATLKLKSFGLDPLDGSLKALVDTNARVGGSAETLNRIILAAGQSFAKGRLQGEELLQFAEAGVPVFDALSRITGKTTAEVIKLAEKGALGRDVIKQLLDELGRQNAGAAAAQMETLTGRLSTAKDAYTEFLNQVANNGPLELAKKTLADVTTNLSGAGETARFLGTSITVAANLLLSAFQVVRAQVLSVKLVLGAFAAAAADVFSALAKGLSLITFGELKQSLQEASTVLAQRSQEFQQSLVEDAEAIKGAYATAGDNIAAAFVASEGAAQSSEQAANAATAAAGQSLQASREAEAAARDQAQAQEAVRKAADAVGVSYDTLTGKVDAASQVVIEGFTQLTAQSGTASEQVGLDAEAIGQAFDSALAKLKSPEALQAFRKSVVESFAAAGRSVDELGPRLALLDIAIEKSRAEQQQATDATRQAYAALGVDVDRVSGVIDAAAQANIKTFALLGQQADSDAKLIEAAFAAVLAKLDTPQELEALKASLASIKNPAFDAAAAVGEIEKKLKVIASAADEAASGINEAFSTLGIESTAQLQRQAQLASAAYERIRRSGVASAGDLTRAAEAKTAAERRYQESINPRTAAEAAAAEATRRTVAADQAGTDAAGERRDANDELTDSLDKRAGAERRLQRAQTFTSTARGDLLEGRPGIDQLSGEDRAAVLELARSEFEELGRVQRGRTAGASTSGNALDGVVRAENDRFNAAIDGEIQRRLAASRQSQREDERERNRPSAPSSPAPVQSPSPSPAPERERERPRQPDRVVRVELQVRGRSFPFDTDEFTADQFLIALERAKDNAL